MRMCKKVKYPARPKPTMSHGNLRVEKINQMGEGCQTAKCGPEKYPAQPKGGMSHGPELLGQRYK